MKRLKRWKNWFVNGAPNHASVKGLGVPGFTLLELAVVIFILAILAAILLPALARG